jgi:hypothetical protein
MTTPQLIGPNQRAWLDALRSGAYPKGRGHLFDGQSYCVLGVACIAAGEKFVPYYENFSCLGNVACLPSKVVSWLDIRPYVELQLISLNDTNGKTFAEIADTIEANPQAYFGGPK